MRFSGFARLGARIPGCPDLAHHTSGKAWGPQHLYHLETWWTFQALPKFQSDALGVGEHSVMSHALGVLVPTIFGNPSWLQSAQGLV